MKKRRSKTCCIILSCMCIVGFIYAAVHSEEGSNVQKGIARQIIRFHVIANSDTRVDQNVKLVVKDQVVTYMQQKLSKVKNREQAQKVMEKELTTIKRIAQKTVKKQGAEYTCDVVYHEREFPVKMYGDLAFPAGKYEALDVILGNAKGKNWWCVMFPSLCFVNGTYAVVPDNSKERLKEVLTEKEYKTISENETVKVEFACKLVQWWNMLKKQIVKRVE